MVVAATGGRQPDQVLAGQPATEQWVSQTAAAVVAWVSRSHPSWQMWHVRAEAERAARTAGVALADLDNAVDAVVTRALSPAHAIALAGSMPVPDPAGPRRRDGSSVYSVPGAARFISQPVIEAQEHLAAAPQRGDDPAPVVEMALVESAAGEVTLNPAQAPGAAEMTTSGAGLQPALALAGINNTPSRADSSEVETDDEALFHAAYQREYSPAPDLDAFDTERQLVEANKWDHAAVPRARLLELNELAAFFSAGYTDSWGPAYVSSRLGTDLADHPSFRPGYAPAGWTHLSDHLRDLGFSDQEILAAGLARVGRNGHVIDQFRGRLVVPIRNGQQITGFIGRRDPALAAHAMAGPKYLNTARTDLFDKGAQLFGLSEGRAALEAGATPVLVEGFFDSIAVTLATGGRYVGLASLGTTITAAQAHLLRPHIGGPRPPWSRVPSPPPPSPFPPAAALPPSPRWARPSRRPRPTCCARISGRNAPGSASPPTPTLPVRSQPSARSGCLPREATPRAMCSFLMARTPPRSCNRADPGCYAPAWTRHSLWPGSCLTNA